MKELRKLRRDHGFTQTELGKLAGLTQHTVSELETGKQEPHPSTIRKLAEALNVSAVRLTQGPELFSLEWAGTATEAEFYQAIMEAPENEIDTLDRLAAKMVKLTNYELQEAYAESRGGGANFDKQAPEGSPLDPRKRPMMRERMKELVAEVKRRRPPFATLKQWAPWIGRKAEVRWLVPPDEWDQHRHRVEEMLDDPTDYLDVDARAGVPEPEETPLYAY